MHFTGTVFFDFSTHDVWRLYTVLLRASQDRSVAVDVEWRGFTTEDLESGSNAVRGLAACEAVWESFPEQHDRFVRALLTLVFQDRDEPGTDKTLAVAAKVAGLEAADVLTRVDVPGMQLLASGIESARERGVGDVPTIERQGPPVLIKTNGAASYGDAVARLQLIDQMMRDDGIWVMSKPA
jgi:hypothetical protein